MSPNRFFGRLGVGLVLVGLVLFEVGSKAQGPKSEEVCPAVGGGQPCLQICAFCCVNTTAPGIERAECILDCVKECHTATRTR